MIKNIFILVIVQFVLTSFSIPPSVEKKAAKEIEKFFDTENFELLTLNFNESQTVNINAVFNDGNLFKIKIQNNIVGYGYIGNAPSKTATFDYLVLFDTQFIITKTKVLTYREEYGGEISSRRWLQQFDGKRASSQPLKYNDDIIPISGATISVKSMTRAINDLLSGIAILQSKKLL